MERVCSVETWAEFGCRFPVTAQVIRSTTEVLICPGNNEIYIFNKEELKLTAVLQFPAQVCHLVLSDDKQLLYAVCDKQGVYCAHLDSLLPRSLAPSSPTDLALRNVTADWLAVRDEEVCSVILVGGTLLTVSLCETAWLFSIYRTTSSSSSSAPDHQKISQFSLPAVLAYLHDDSKENAGRGLGMQPVLACVYSSDAAVPLSSSSLSLGDRHFLIETLLFKLLFGVDAALLKSPIILCGLPDGRLCFLPKQSLLGQPEPRVKVLHSLEQPITFIGTSVAPEMGVGSQCVVVVGHQGKVVLVHAQEAGPEEGVKVASFREGCVPGPVVCVCPGPKCLYYSTESDLWELDLLGGGGGEEAGPGEGDVLLQAARPGKVQCVETIQCPKSLGVSGVIALTGPSYTQTSGAVQLVALSSRGRLQRLLLPQRSKDGGLPQLLPSQVGQKIRDLLAAIGDVWERASVLKSTSQSRNQTLKRLNQVLNISCLLSAYRSHGERPHTQQRPIRCGVVPSWSRLLQKDLLSLTCVLDNSSPYVLEDGWTLCVQVMPLCHSSAEGGGNTSRTFSFRLSRLEAGEKTDVSLPLSTVDTSYPMTISCSLVFSLQSLLGREEMAGLLAKGKTAVSALGLDNTGYVTLALDMLTVDWLDALKVKGTTPTHGITFGRSVSTDTVAMDTIQAYLSSRGFRRASRGDGAGGVETEGRLFSARVVVSSAILRSALKPRAPDSAPLGETGSPELGSLVLDWLLSQGSGGQERRERGDQKGLGIPVVYAMAPGGHTVKLTATEVTVGEVTLEEENLAAVEVKVESSSVAAVGGLHHAVLCRVQVLLQSVAGTCFSSLSVQGLRLRQALQQAEALLQKIQESRIPEAFGQETVSGQVTATLLSVYQHIRENPLIIT